MFLFSLWIYLLDISRSVYYISVSKDITGLDSFLCIFLFILICNPTCFINIWDSTYVSFTFISKWYVLLGLILASLVNPLFAGAKFLFYIFLNTLLFPALFLVFFFHPFSQAWSHNWPCYALHGHPSQSSMVAQIAPLPLSNPSEYDAIFNEFLKWYEDIYNSWFHDFCCTHREIIC